MQQRRPSSRSPPRHSAPDDASSPFARGAWRRLSPEEQDAAVAKKRAQRLAAEALDQQLREKGALRAEGRPSARPHLLQPTASAPATVHRAGPPSVQSDGSEADAGPEKHEWSHIQRRSRSDVMVDELADRSDGQAWWHQVPPNEYLPRRRGGNELMRSPEEARAREAERRKKLVVGEALR